MEALVENVPCRVTIDTGSSITIANSTLLPSLNIPIENIRPVRNSIRTVTGDKVPLVGRGQMTITVGNTKFIHDVWIGDITEDVILGLDFMTLHRCQLDLEHSSICVGGEYVSLLYNGKRDAECYRVVVSTAVTIPPRTEVIVKGSVRGTKSVKGYCTIEPCKHNVPDVLVGKVLANLDNCFVPVRVLNIADKPRKIKRGVCLARCETVSGDDVFGEGTDEESRTNEHELPTREDDLPNHLHSLYNRSACSLQNEEEQVLLKNFLCEYSDVFSKSASDIGQTNVVKHSIFTGDHPPIKPQARRMPRVKREEAGRAVDEMLKDGIIEQSTSPWSSPIVLVRKKNGTTRFCMDYFTKWPEVYPIANQEAETIAKVLVEQFVCRFGVPLQIHSDQGRNFCSKVFNEMCTLLGVKKTQTTPYHPQSDGMIERYNRTLEAQLSMFVEAHQKDWDQYIPYLLMAYRTAVHESTKCTPTKLMMGREIRVPIDLVFGRPEPECYNEGELWNKVS